MFESSDCSTSLPTFGVVNYLNFSYSTGIIIIINNNSGISLDFICIPLMTNDVKNLFICLLVSATCISSLKYLLKSSVCFFSWDVSLFIIEF